MDDVTLASIDVRPGNGRSAERPQVFAVVSERQLREHIARHGVGPVIDAADDLKAGIQRIAATAPDR